MILKLVLHWILAAVLLMAIGSFVPGIYISGLAAALFATLIMGLINVLIRPLAILLTLPVNVLTLGLFTFIINALMFALAAWLVPGFEVLSFGAALLGSLLMTLLAFLLHSVERGVPQT